MAVEPYTEDELRGIIRGLEEKYASAVLSTGFSDRNVMYVSNLQERIAYFKTELRKLLGGHSRQTLAVATKGFA